MSDHDARTRNLRNFETEVGDGRILYKPRKPKWTPTSITFTTDANIDFLTAVYVDNGSKCLRFVLAPERDWDTEAGNC